jgi:hypothetical protein
MCLVCLSKEDIWSHLRCFRLNFAMLFAIESHHKFPQWTRIKCKVQPQKINTRLYSKILRISSPEYTLRASPSAGCGKLVDHQQTCEISRILEHQSCHQWTKKNRVVKYESLEKHQTLVGPMKKNRHYNRPFDAEEKDKMIQAPPLRYESHYAYAV